MMFGFVSPENVTNGLITSYRILRSVVRSGFINIKAECQGSGTNFSDYRVYQALLVLFLTSLRVETMVARKP